MAQPADKGGDVLQSPSDRRTYRWIKLDNGLTVLVIHDPEIGVTDDSGVAAAPRPCHPGEDEVVADDDDVNSLMTGGSSGSSESDSSGSDDEGSDGGDDGSVSSSGSEGGAPRRKGGNANAAVKKAAAAVCVGVGHYSDPWRLQGLSHYLEHMLFMGSEKYPDENDYDAFLSAQGGASNACTEEEATTFHFDCRPGALRPALDRFAQFFVAPLLKADALEREVRAVDSEFTGVTQSDGCRLSQLRAHTARPRHVASKFGWGNRRSLVDDPAGAGVDVRAELLRHYGEQYSAERMNLVILGGEPVETLQAWAAELFAGVAAGRGPRPTYSDEGPPFEGGRLHILPAVREDHRISVLFQLPCLAKEYPKKAEEYLSHLIGHEGRGSLLAALKARGWASELCAGVVGQTSAAWLFDITITLTEAGLAAGLGCGLAPAALVFEYLSMLRGAGPQLWAWEEMAAIAGMKFRFQEEEDAAEYVAELAGDLHHYPPRHAVAGPLLHEVFDPELISRLLASMTPAAARLDLQTRGYDACAAAAAGAAGPGGVAASEEPWVGIPYVQLDLAPALLAAWGAAPPSPDIELPPRNTYLPSDFSLRCEEGCTAQRAVANGGAEVSPFPSPPDLVHEVVGLRAWHKMDLSFRLPRTAAYFRVACPAGYASARAAAATHLAMKLLEDALCQESYLADVAGLHYSVWFEGQAGLEIKVDGFSHRLPLLVGLVFRSLAALSSTFSSEDFSRVKEALARTYRNARMKPLKHSSYLRLRALRRSLRDVQAVGAELENLTEADVRAFLPTLLADVHIEALVAGNATAEEAIQMAESARLALGALGAGVLGDSALRLLPGSSVLLREAVVNPEEDNSVAEVYLQCGSAADPAARAVLDLVDQLLYEPCYDTLRTKEQLGYTVHSGARLTHGALGLCVLVQGGAHGPAHMDARVDAFLASSAARLAALGEAEFEQNRASLLAAKLQKDRNLLEESDRAWDAIVNRGRDFGGREAEVAALRVVTLAQVRALFDDALAPGAPARQKLAVHIVGRAHAGEMAEAAPTGVEVVHDLEAFKASREFFPPVGQVQAEAPAPAAGAGAATRKRTRK